MPTSSTEDKVGDLFGAEYPLSVLQLLAERDIPVTSRA
jgi:hypothetical protein